jgi:hypothetical protein
MGNPEQYAVDIQAALWRGGRMRSVGLPDLLIAAVAERERVTVLHYDGDYELIAQVTGQLATPTTQAYAAPPLHQSQHDSRQECVPPRLPRHRLAAPGSGRLWFPSAILRPANGDR